MKNMDEGEFKPVPKPIHNPKLYWVFAQSIRLILLPTVLLNNFYESVMDMEGWERKIFIGLCLFIALILIAI